MKTVDAIVVGAGQAGLATSHELNRQKIDHVALERGDIGQSWRDRWDSFCLVTPNWSVQLPGFPYDGDDPDGFMPRDDIVAYLERYAASFDAPVKTQCQITNMGKADGLFTVDTNQGKWQAPNLILATGAYQKPKIPNGADSLPCRLHQMQVGDFTCEADLPKGDVLIIGSGQTGCQIAEELTEAGRRVVLACGRAPWGHRQYWGKDIFWWLIETGFLNAPSADMPDEARLFANILATGHGGGHDLSLRTLAQLGVDLVGRFQGADGNTARFADDLDQSLAWGDEKYQMLSDLFEKAARDRGLNPTALPTPDPLPDTSRTERDLSGFGTVLFTGGFRPDYTSWVPWADAFDDQGFPKQVDGSSTVVDGLHFVGVHFLRPRKSALLYGVGEDASVVAKTIAAQP
jgi:putative flavoprotein involved in K+ transport